MYIVERLEGFDAREDWLSPHMAWPPSRRSLYLLRTDCLKPLSTDVLVWNSIFDVDRDPEWSVGVSGRCLWRSLQDLKDNLHSPWMKDRRPYRIVAITRTTKYANKVSLGAFDETARSLAKQKRKWLFLGYDVSDGGYLSGLMNCGYTPEDSVNMLRSIWVPRLNDNHLFNELSDAIEFCDLTNNRVGEHAPFYVYGLWTVERVAWCHATP